MYVSTVVWLILLYFYISKWWRTRKETLAELNHSVWCCFISLAPISTMLIALAIAPQVHAIAVVLVVVGTAGQISFSLYRSGQLWKGGREPETTTPVLYLPTVASNLPCLQSERRLSIIHFESCFYYSLKHQNSSKKV